VQCMDGKKEDGVWLVEMKDIVALGKE
jgi:hypothetical protein